MEKKYVYNKTDQEIAQLAMDIVDEKVFGSWDLKGAEFSSILPLIFMPLMFIEEDTKEQVLKADTAHLYEYFSEASPRSVNGYPIFFSFRMLSKENSNQVFEKVELYKQFKSQILVSLESKIFELDETMSV